MGEKMTKIEYAKKWYGDEIARGISVAEKDMVSRGWKKTGEKIELSGDEDQPEIKITIFFASPGGTVTTREAVIRHEIGRLMALRLSGKIVQHATPEMPAEQVDDFFQADRAEKLEKIIEAAKNGIWARDEKGHFTRLEIG